VTYGGVAVRDSVRLLFLLGVAVTGCSTAGDLARGEADAVHLAYDAPAAAVFVAALEAVAGGEFEVTGQDQRLGEIRLHRGPYQHGLFVCYGNVLGVFLTSEGETRTKVEIVERYFSRAQLVGCRTQTPAYVERLNAKVSASQTRGAASGAMSADVEWVSPEGTPEARLKQDRYECLKESASLQQQELYAACMEARGYRRRTQ
jgi:hypothetical protein